MQGETGTSHAYEMGGDYPSAPSWKVGRLGADLVPVDGGWRVARVVRGEPGDRARSSPLLGPGLAIAQGDVIVEVGGVPAAAGRPFEQALVHLAGEPVELVVRRGEEQRRVVVRTLADERPLRYRQWVLDNRRRVHEASSGRCG